MVWKEIGEFERAASSSLFIFFISLQRSSVTLLVNVTDVLQRSNALRRRNTAITAGYINVPTVFEITLAHFWFKLSIHFETTQTESGAEFLPLTALKRCKLRLYDYRGFYANGNGFAQVQAII